MSRANSTNLWRWSALAFYAISVAFIYFLLDYLVSARKLLFANSPTSLIMPILVYLSAHLVRAVRLGVLIGDISVRQLLILHLYCAACSAFIPFKLGELARVNEVSRWMHSYWKGIVVVWIERLFDVLVLAGLTVFVATTGSSAALEQLRSLLWLIGGFVTVSVLFFLILPEQLCALNLHVIKKYQRKKAINFLRAIDSLYELLHQARPMLAGRWVTLTVLTLLVWGFELQALALVFAYDDWGRAAGTLAYQLSGLISLGHDQGQLPQTLLAFDNLKLALIGVLGLVAMAFYLKLRRTRTGGIPYE